MSRVGDYDPSGSFAKMVVVGRKALTACNVPAEVVKQMTEEAIVYWHMQSLRGWRYSSNIAVEGLNRIAEREFNKSRKTRRKDQQN